MAWLIDHQAALDMKGGDLKLEVQLIHVLSFCVHAAVVDWLLARMIDPCVKTSMTEIGNPSPLDSPMEVAIVFPSVVPPTHFKRPGGSACVCLHACVFVARFFD